MVTLHANAFAVGLGVWLVGSMPFDKAAVQTLQMSGASRHVSNMMLSAQHYCQALRHERDIRSSMRRATKHDANDS
jgi:adenylosuccinate lyase